MMADRAQAAQTFLDAAGWGAARRTPLTGDASLRTYERLDLDGSKAVLMNAPVEILGSCAADFDRIAGWLAAHGFSAPEIYHVDTEAGFLLSEDLGDALFARLIARTPEMESELYSTATRCLAELHRLSPPEPIAVYDAHELVRLAGLAVDWYVPGAGHPVGPAAMDIGTEIARLHARVADDPMVLVLRDFHAENLIWLPERTGISRVGLLDFQDAVAGHRAYDLVSMLQDARRDVPIETERQMLTLYIGENSLDQKRFSAAYALMGAQRNLRILGVFARLSMHFARPHYVDFMPRVWGYLLRNLEHPDLAGLSRAVHACLPAPTPEIMQRIKARCGTVPTL